jgi:PAS domain S-box-containing protein
MDLINTAQKNVHEDPPLWSRQLWWVLTLASLITIVLWVRPAAGFHLDWTATSIGIVLVAFLVNFPIPVGEVPTTLAHAIGLPIGMALGPGSAGIVLVGGITIGEFIHAFFQQRHADPPPGIRIQIRNGALIFSRQVLSISGAMTIYLLLGGRFLNELLSLPMILPTLSLLLIFSAIFLALHWLSRRISHPIKMDQRDTITLILIALVPIPFAIFSAASYVFLETVALVIYGAMVVTVSPIVRSLAVAERNLQRRVQELSTISRVSQVMRTSLDLEKLLSTIHSQVTELLVPDTFFIALQEPENQLISYPLVVREGKELKWSSRQIGDRLSDRVIRSGEPILIPRDAPRALKTMGVTISDGPPQAWLGVPLRTADRTIGCLVASHNRPDKAFTRKDQEVLVTLAGQATVAIENALLYEQTRNRAEALALLNEITASMSSTLDPERALELVCLSMIRVGGGQKSVIFLLDEDHGRLFLAHATNLSNEFIKSWENIPLVDLERIQAFHTEEPLLISDVSSSNLPQSIVSQMEIEGIRAFADFPLITPSGTIGQLSVYFSNSHQFHVDQIELLKTFAAQAALAVANARAHAETDEALGRRIDQLATLEAIGREMTSTLIADDLFTAILTHAMDIPQAAIGYLAIYEEELGELRIAAHHGYPADSPFADAITSIPLDKSIIGRAFQTGKPINIPDLRQELPPLNWHHESTISVLSIPILRQGRVLGVITVEDPSPYAFSAEHIQLLSQLASQAAVALTNATLYQQLEARLREQSLLYQASTQIAATYETEDVAMAIVDSLAVALSTEGARVSKWNPDSRTLTPQAMVLQGKPLNDQASAPIAIDDVPGFTSCLSEHKPVQWTRGDAPSQADQDYLTRFPQALSLLAVPLVTGTQTLGLIEVFCRRERTFDENAIRTAQTIASQAAVALENTDLFRRIRENRNLLMAVLNSTREGMLMTDTQGKIVLANQQLEVLTGLRVEDLVENNLSEVDVDLADFMGYQHYELVNIINSLQAGHPPQGEVTTFDVEAPSRRTLQRSDAPVYDINNQMIGWLVVLRDLTEERELSQTREQLTEMIVHDLRAPLTAILGSLNLLDKTLSDEEQLPVVKQALSISNRSVEQMLGLVNSLLDLAKLETGELPLSLSEFSLDTLCEELVGTFVQEANENGIILNYRADDMLPEITADNEKIRRVLANLLDNALKYTPAGGRIELAIEAMEDKVNITVADTGPGVSEEFREKIFKRFIQVPGVAGRRRGTGLGLAFSKMAILAHGGKIWMEENPGGGSAFRIHLPLHP